MYYFETLSVSERNASDEWNAQLADFVGDHLFLLLDALELARAIAWFEPRPSHTVAQRIAWQLAEHLDGIGVLTRAGCARAVRAQLPVAFEQVLALEYLLHSDSERRALAYQAFDLQERIRFWERSLSTGQAFPEGLAPPAGDARPLKTSRQLAHWKAALAAFGDAANEAQRRRTEEDRHELKWYSLFDGPRDICELAQVLGQENCYRLLCAGESVALEHTDNRLPWGGTEPQLRPLRDPEGLPRWVRLAAQLAEQASDRLLACYGTHERRASFAARRERLVGDRARELAAQS